jgi:hypothetical protein
VRTPWVRCGTVPGVREKDGQTWIAGRVVEIGRPPPSGYFTKDHHNAAETTEILAGAGLPDDDAWRD